MKAFIAWPHSKKLEKKQKHYSIRITTYWAKAKDELMTAHMQKCLIMFINVFVIIKNNFIFKFRYDIDSRSRNLKDHVSVCKKSLGDK